MASVPLNVEHVLDDDFSTFLRHTSVGVVQLGAPHGEIARANPAFHALIGSDEPVIGRRFLELDWINSELQEKFGAMLAGTENEVQLIIQVNSGNIGRRWLSIHAVAHGKNGKRRIFVTVNDATLRVELLSVLSHELRNPLAPIRNASRIARMPTTTPDQLHWSLEVIERQVDHLTRLVDDLLDISRITRGRLELRKERVLLNDALAAAVETVRPLLDARQHHLHFELPDEPMWVQGDPVRLAQIFSNLLGNSAKYTGTMGEISLAVHEEGATYVVVVSDNGEGIGPELLPRVFEMFAQSPQHGRREGGLGIGLALVDGLVKLHQGSVEAHSEGPGRGSQFTVRLPVFLSSPSRHGLMQDDLVDAALRQLRILVADDNVDAADSLALLLRLQGHDVRVAHDGLGAVREAETFRPQVALIDIGMPIMNGHDVARWIRAQDWGATVRVIALTGWNQPMDRVQTSLSGFDRHLAKPVSMSDLAACFADVQPGASPEGSTEHV